MNTEHITRWTVRERALPAVIRPCAGCAESRHHASGGFRVNTCGKIIDVWLLLRCAACGRGSKVPVYRRRVHLAPLEPARRAAFEADDPDAVRELAMSATLAARNGYRLDWTDTWELDTDAPSYALDDPSPLTVRVRYELPAPIRVERLLMLGFGVSRGRVRRMVADGRLRLPLPLDAMAYQDFDFVLDAPDRSDPRDLLLDAPVRVEQSVH